MANIINLLNYQPIPRELVFDNSISDRARFLYVYMASKPEGWEFFLSPMASDLGYSVDTVRKYLKELMQSGWISTEGQQADENGKFGASVYIINATKNTVSEKYRVGKIPTRKKSDTNIKEIDKETDINIKENICSGGRKFVKPTREAVAEYIRERGYHFTADHFVDYYESNGWRVGRNPMRSWKAACNTWEQNSVKGWQRTAPAPPAKKETSLEAISKKAAGIAGNILRGEQARTPQSATAKGIYD